MSLERVEIRPSSGQRSSGINPMAVWRWGFSAIMFLAGLYLIISQPDLDIGTGGSDGAQTLGWIIIGYSVLRTGLGWLADRRHNRRSLRSEQARKGYSA